MPKYLSFSPLQRIRQRPDYQRTFRYGKRLYSDFFILYYHLGSLHFPRMGVIVSKKSAKKAVQRNLIKRLSRETFRLNQNVLKSVDIVIVAQKRAGSAGKEEITQCLKTLFLKLKK